MIIDLNKGYEICPICKHPYFETKTVNLYAKGANFSDPSLQPIETITKIYCAKCGALISKHPIIKK